MKTIRFFTICGILLAFGLTSCRTNETDLSGSVPGQEPAFHATLEGAAPDVEANGQTKVFADGLQVKWNADDLITLFDKTTQNKKFRFTGSDGDSSGDFEVVGSYSPGSAITYNYALYPYDENASYMADNIICTTFPQQQTYRANSFGPGANLMIARSTTEDLSFKNVGGYLCLKLYGSGITVRSITLTGNAGENLAGPVKITPGSGGIPSMVFDDSDPSKLKKSITLDVSASPVALGADAAASTTFWMVVPPVTFASGITVTVVDTDGKIYVKSTGNSVTIQRNKQQPMAAFDVPSCFVDFGIYPAGGAAYTYNKTTDRMSIYQVGSQAWFRFLTIPTWKMVEIGPIPVPVAEGDPVAAFVYSVIDGVDQGDETSYSLTVQSFHGGILNLVSNNGDRFVIRF